MIGVCCGCLSSSGASGGGSGGSGRCAINRKIIRVSEVRGPCSRHTEMTPAHCALPKSLPGLAS